LREEYPPNKSQGYLYPVVAPYGSEESASFQEEDPRKMVKR
jgi:hypothetical protein